MKRNNTFWLQKGLVYSFITITVLLFIVGLGFMTNYYKLFFDGTPDMYEFYKDVQVFNRVLFKSSLVFVIMAFLFIAFDINKEKNGIVGVIYTLVVSYYVLSTTAIILRAIPYYQNIYEAFDFSTIDNYVPSSLAFNASRYFSYGLIVIIIPLTVVVVVRFIKSTIDKRSIKNG